jgi:hypothetical protein
MNPHDLDGYTPKTDRPTSVYQAILMMNEDVWDEMAYEIFDCHPAALTAEKVLDKIRETDTCRDLRSPVEVYIDSQGHYSVSVYDENRSAA